MGDGDTAGKETDESRHKPGKYLEFLASGVSEGKFGV